jgi:hypothetical protein
MKKFILHPSILLGVLLSFLQITYADPIELQVALKAANGKIVSLSKSPTYSVASDAVEIINETQQIVGFLFRLEPAGYILVAADDNLPPVIAYDFLADFPMGNDEYNPALQMIRADISLRMSNIEHLPNAVIQNRKVEWQRLIENPDVPASDFLFQQWPPEGTTSTGGWLETNYTQSPPYNNFCPMDPVTNLRSVAGCPATAMAQILNYYETVNGTYFTDEDDYHHNYAGRNYWIDDDHVEIDFPSFPDLNAWLDTIAMSFESNSLLKNDEKAALTFACGVAAHQVYTSQVSGTFGVDQAEDAYLRFGFTEALLLENTDTTLFTQLAQNMMDARPAHLAVVDPGWTMGHNVVADGYNTDEYFHLNFGWGGSYNGWYLLPDEIPYGLTVIEGLIVNIAYPPVNTGAVDHPGENSLSFNLYPNPAENELTLDFTIVQPSCVKIEIYDICGSLVRQIMEDLFNEGSYTKSFEIRNDQNMLVEGLYLCKLRINDKIFTKKFVVR